MQFAQNGPQERLRERPLGSALGDPQHIRLAERFPSRPNECQQVGVDLVGMPCGRPGRVAGQDKTSAYRFSEA
jgi:hypothetical protein